MDPVDEVQLYFVPKILSLSSQKYVFGIRDPRLGIRDPGSEIRDSGPGIRDQGSETRDKRFGIRDPGSAIRDPGSGMRDPEKILTRSRGQKRKLSITTLADLEFKVKLGQHDL